ncbi:MAG: hypothetical protein K0S65_5146, partial [Labilithrix sp.]|nr:hypothetical protein [Labilithrix sp.]
SASECDGVDELETVIVNLLAEVAMREPFEARR